MRIVIDTQFSTSLGVWSRGAFYRFLASVGRGLETLLLAEVRQHYTNLVRHLSNVVPLSAPTLLRSACTNREQQALLHVGLPEETATVVELHEALEEGISGTEEGYVVSSLHVHRAEPLHVTRRRPICNSVHEMKEQRQILKKKNLGQHAARKMKIDFKCCVKG